LAELTHSGLTSSFFNASEFAVAEASGIEALGQLVGVSHCALSLGVIRRTRGPTGRLPVGSSAWRERSGPIRSWTTARTHALARLRTQAKILNANGVLGITAKLIEDKAEPAVQVVLTGTAVRIPTTSRPTDAPPVLGLISPQELCLLRQAGVEVVGVAGSDSSVEVTPGSSTRRALAGRLARVGSQELDDLTVGVYEARRLAVERLRADARALNATGVIGADLSGSLDQHHITVRRTTVSVHLLATAVRRVANHTISPSMRIGLGN
jgi:uncharacterized protein YbjQ (UPF0145 family)